MARSSNIWAVETNNYHVVRLFTVKHEMVTWIQRHLDLTERKRYLVVKYKDNQNDSDQRLLHHYGTTEDFLKENGYDEVKVY